MSEMIVKLNSDRVKIKGCEYVQDLVRCKDCVRNNECRMLDYDDDFCSLGERKESER